MIYNSNSSSQFSLQLSLKCFSIYKNLYPALNMCTKSMDRHGDKMQSNKFDNRVSRGSCHCCQWSRPASYCPDGINKMTDDISRNIQAFLSLVCDLNRTPIVTAKHGGTCVHFSGISTCGRTSRETVSHPQHAPLPTLCKISLPVYVMVTNERLQPLTTTWYTSLVLSFSLLKI